MKIFDKILVTARDKFVPDRISFLLEFFEKIKYNIMFIFAFSENKFRFIIYI